MAFTVKPLTPALWGAFEDLFDTTGPVGRCWCMYWRIGNSYRKRAPAANKADFHNVVENEPSPGLLAFDGELPVGWCQLTPRSALPWLARTPHIDKVDDQPVWSISCFYVHKRYRKKGITTVLIEEAINVAKRAGAPALEAYPLDADLTPSASGTGFVSNFKRAGFIVVSDSVPARPVLRYEFKQT